MKKKVVITGASGGFGSLIVRTLIANGHQVAGTMRTTTGRNEKIAQELKELGATLVEMDVTNTESVERGVKEAVAQLGGIDVLINNAGVGVLGMQEHFTPEDLQYVFEVNVVGVQRVMRAVLPILRKQGRGQVLYISSLLGRITLPFYGPYNASKWALEALAENYRTELSGFGVESIIVEPGGFPTTFMDNLKKPSDTSREGEYGEFMNAPQGMFQGFEQALEANTEQRPEKVAIAVNELLNSPFGESPFRKVVDYMGMGDHINNYNDNLHQITHGIYSAFGNEGMLEVNK